MEANALPEQLKSPCGAGGHEFPCHGGIYADFTCPGSCQAFPIVKSLSSLLKTTSTDSPLYQTTDNTSNLEIHCFSKPDLRRSFAWPSEMSNSSL